MISLGFCCCPEPSSELPQRIEGTSMPSLLQGGFSGRDPAKKQAPVADEPPSSMVKGGLSGRDSAKNHAPSSMLKESSIPDPDLNEVKATLGEENVANIAIEVDRRLTRSFSRKQPKDVSPEETPEEHEEELAPPSRQTTRKMTQRISFEAATTHTTSSSQVDEHREVYRDMSLRTEQMHVEKVRLQSVISKFAVLAVKGRSCIHIDERSGKRVSAKYKLDKALKKFTISHNGIFAWKAVCAVGAVQDVEILENSATPLPPQVLSALMSQEEKDLLVRVVYQDSVGRLSSFCLLEDSHQARDIFVQSLMILRHDA